MLVKKRLSNNSSVTVNNEREQWKKSIYRSDFAGRPVVQGYSVSFFSTFARFLLAEGKDKKQKQKNEKKKTKRYKR